MELRTHGLALTLDLSPPNEDDYMRCLTFQLGQPK
jgi:hypothetical protein